MSEMKQIKAVARDRAGKGAARAVRRQGQVVHWPSQADTSSPALTYTRKAPSSATTKTSSDP